jgi:hypothetical protein
MAGMYKIKANFSYLDNEMVAGNIQSLSEVPSDILAEWIKNGMVEPYKV